MFGISRQSVYQKEKHYALRYQELQLIKKEVLKIRMLMPRIGTRKLYYLLKNRFEELSVKIGRDGLFKFLKSENMLIKPKKNYTKTTHSKHWLRKHPNLYTNMEIKEPEEVFVSDITYIKTREQTHYLSLVTDAYSRKIMGYHLSEDMSSENVVKALKMAIRNRKTNKPLIHHSDRGLQYCSALYQDVLAKNKIRPSMTDGYDCYQNALAERMNRTIKEEFGLGEVLKTKEQGRQLIEEAVFLYNNFRPHLALNYQTPSEVHKKMLDNNVNYQAFN